MIRWYDYTKKTSVKTVWFCIQKTIKRDHFSIDHEVLVYRGVFGVIKQPPLLTMFSRNPPDRHHHRHHDHGRGGGGGGDPEGFGRTCLIMGAV